MTISTQGLAERLTVTAQGFNRGWWLAGAAFAFLVIEVMLPGIEQKAIAAVVSMTLVFVLFGLVGGSAWRSMANRRFEAALERIVGGDATPCFTTADLGEIRYQNAAAVARFGANSGTTLVATLQDHFASPASVLYRLQNRAAHNGSARDDVVTRRGHSRLSVQRLSDQRFLWRLEEFVDRAVQSGRGADGLSLPMVTANKAGVVLFSNEAMRRLVGGRPKRLDRLFSTDVLHSGEEIQVATATGPIRAILAEVDGLAERREIFLLPVTGRSQKPEVRTEFEHFPVALLQFQSDGTVSAANAVARDLIGFVPDQQPLFHEMFEGLGRPVSDWLADVVAERIPASTEILHLRSGDSEQFLQVSLRRHVEQGRPGAIAVLQDATALKRLEAQFAQSQKMQAIGQLAGGIAHDFNNLLTAISGHCDLLLLRHDTEDSEYADLIQIHQNSNRAAALVSQLLAFSRKQTLKPQIIDIEEILSELAHLLNRLVGEKIDLHLNHAAQLGRIRADKRQLEQVIMNLVVNARDAMPRGGVIQLQSESVTLTEDLQRDRAVVPAGEYAVIKVQDTGEGIPADRLQKIFEPFYTTKRAGEGTGLGLSTAYGIVKQSGGFIFVDSKEGEGTLFQLFFPLYQETDETQQPEAEAGPVRMIARGEGVILLVEDEAPVRAFASRALRLRGFTVLEAANAEDALKTLENKELDVDVFVTDVVMPGLDGPSWVRRALQDRPDTKVIFVSGYSEEALTEDQGRIPNSVFLPKPFSLNELTLTVQRQLM